MKTDIRNILATKTKQALSSNILNASNIRQNIIILDELQSFIPPLSTDEFGQLESNILQHGCQTPIQVWQTSKKNLGLPFEKVDDLAYILVDGHNRYKICSQHNLPFEVYVLSFDSQKDAKDYMINLQLGRRNLSQNQISYFRGLRYNNEKADKLDNLQANSSKGQNVPSINDAQKEEENRTNSSKGQNVPSVKTTAERLAKEYNVSSKTIKRDAEFAEGLEKINPELRNDILIGKAKVDKGMIQKLSKSQVELPINSLQELQISVSKPDLKGEQSRGKSLSARVRESVKNAEDADLMIIVKGGFILKNGLESVWRELRGLSDEVVIDKNYIDTISISQAPILGIIDKL